MNQATRPACMAAIGPESPVSAVVVKALETT